jgi:hypothetical protein
MLQDLAALTPPAIVCAAVLIGAWAIVRRELAPKRKERAEAAATADEERAVDREHGRSLYSRHRRFIYTRRSAMRVLSRGVRSPAIIRLRRRQRIVGMTTCAWVIC